MSEKQAAQSEGGREQHHAHPGHLPQQARQAVPEARPRSDGGEQDIARARGSRDNRRERHERDQLGWIMHEFHLAP
jgi:hypothetical protein